MTGGVTAVLRRFVLLGIALLALAAAVLVAFNAWVAATGPRARDVANSRFLSGPSTHESPGTEVVAYIAKPAPRVLRPGIVLVHEWWGLDAETAAKADRLSALGYAVFAPDTYRGQAAEYVSRALWLRLTVPEERVLTDLDGAVRHLQGVDTVDPERIAVVGFCYGGEMALRYAATNDRLAGVAVFYGRPPEDSALGAIAARKIPVLGVFGADDRRLGPAVAAAFDADLTAAGVPHDVTVYPGVGHAFVQTGDIDPPGPAHDAWAQLEAWLAATMRP